MNKILKSDNPRYSQDDDGQWWYQPNGATKAGRSWPRIRAVVHKCSVCEMDFLWQVRTRHNSTANKGYFCSVGCANRSPDKLQGAPRGKDHKSWRGGRRRDCSGYIQVWSNEHPNRNKNNYVYEHRLVMEQMIGRQLLGNENVHHINGIRDDNRPENLELWVKSQPAGQRVTDMLDHARLLLETYADIESKLR